jgi:hypothetical protein
MLHAPGGGSIRRIAEQANANEIWFANTWGTLPWFTPFDAGDYYTLYAVPEEFPPIATSQRKFARRSWMRLAAANWSA